MLTLLSGIESSRAASLLALLLGEAVNVGLELVEVSALVADLLLELMKLLKLLLTDVKSFLGGLALGERVTTRLVSAIDDIMELRQSRCTALSQLQALKVGRGGCR
jgi:hypothetical protein